MKRGRHIVEKRERERESRTRSPVPVQKMNTEKSVKCVKSGIMNDTNTKKNMSDLRLQSADTPMDSWTGGHVDIVRERRENEVRGLDSQRHHSNSHWKHVWEEIEI